MNGTRAGDTGHLDFGSNGDCLCPVVVPDRRRVDVGITGRYVTSRTMGRTEKLLREHLAAIASKAVL